MDYTSKKVGWHSQNLDFAREIVIRCGYVCPFADANDEYFFFLTILPFPYMIVDEFMDLLRIYQTDRLPLEEISKFADEPQRLVGLAWYVLFCDGDMFYGDRFKELYEEVVRPYILRLEPTILKDYYSVVFNCRDYDILIWEDELMIPNSIERVSELVRHYIEFLRFPSIAETKQIAYIRERKSENDERQLLLWGE